MFLRIGLLSLFLPFLCSSVAAQQPTQPGATIAPAKDLEFPVKLSRPSIASPEMALFKPDGSGPFPALVLHHQCGGLRQGKWQNMALLDWTRAAVGRGYVVLLIDSLGPRGGETVCMGPKGGVTFGRGARDAIQAAEHLRKLEFVEKKRIAHVGFSWGAMVGLFANSKSFRRSQGNLDSFAAFIGFYPGCFTIKPTQSAPYEIVKSDMERPHLVLMGDKDEETPADQCVAKLGAAKSNGAQAEWHVYPKVGHCWDCKNLNGFSKVDVRGTRVVYHYSEPATADARRRLFEFLDKAWVAKP